MVKKVKENMFIIDKEKSCLWNRKIKIEPSSRFAKSLSEITKKKKSSSGCTYVLNNRVEMTDNV